MNEYIAIYKKKQINVTADTTLAAQQQAAKIFKAKKAYDVTVVLVMKKGEQVTHLPLF